MEKQLRGYIFRMYPTKEQQVLIEKSFGTSRYIYNHFLEESIKLGKMNAYELIKKIPELTKENIWLKEVDSCLLRSSIFDLDKAYQKRDKEEKGLPKFKSKNKSRKSYRTNNVTSTYKDKKYESIKIALNNKTITLPKLKEVKIRGYRKLNKINGRIINATIYKGLNRWLSRSKVGSKNRYKIKKKLARVYQKLKNARKFYLHRISKEITEENDIIVTEHLKISNMVKNKNISKQIYDVSWNELIRQLIYKSKWKGKKFYQVETYYPSSQICSHCGNKNRKVKDLSIREWKCEKCNHIVDRDINAAINIMYEGVIKYMDELAVN